MDDLAFFVDVLRRGGVVACPTETWLGLLADARSEAAIERFREDLIGKQSSDDASMTYDGSLRTKRQRKVTTNLMKAPERLSTDHESPSWR